MGKVKLSRVCVLCRKDVNDELKFGALKATKLMRVHYYCLLLSETISQSGQDDEGILGFMASDIVKEVNRTKNQKCCYCNKSPATIGCSNNTCNRKFHLYCGYENNAVFNFDKFDARCNLHTLPSNVPTHIKRSLSDYHCLICLEMFDANTRLSDVIWANCCKSNVILHSNCIRQMALSAGYFTKCPGCNNDSKFINTIKAWGIFVPERDASWEWDRNAFSELLYVHSKCDQKNCSCPNGREHSEENGKWKLMLCKMCGSIGAHVACSEYKRKFTCAVCSMDTPSASSTQVDESNNSIVDLTTEENESADIVDIEVIEIPEEDDILNNQDEVEIIDDFNVEVQHNDIEPNDHNRKTPQKKNDVEVNCLKHDKSPSKKRLFEINNVIDRDEENSHACKKIKVDMDASDNTDVKDGSPMGYHKIPDAVLAEQQSPSYTVMLDDNNEVEFISCSDVGSFSSESNHVDLFLNTVLSNSDDKNDKCNKENEINCNILQACDAQQNYLSERGSKTGKRVVELNFRNYTNCAKVSF